MPKPKPSTITARQETLRTIINELYARPTATSHWKILVYGLELAELTDTRITNALMRHVIGVTEQYTHWFSNPTAWLKGVADGVFDIELQAVHSLGAMSLKTLKQAARSATDPNSTNTLYTTPRQNVYDAINRERHYQDTKWGPPDHDVAGWLLIIEAELAEAKYAWVKGDGDLDALTEILQLAATAVACIEQHGIYERKETTNA